VEFTVAKLHLNTLAGELSCILIKKLARPLNVDIIFEYRKVKKLDFKEQEAMEMLFKTAKTIFNRLVLATYRSMNR